MSIYTVIEKVNYWTGTIHNAGTGHTCNDSGRRGTWQYIFWLVLEESAGTQRSWFPVERVYPMLDVSSGQKRRLSNTSSRIQAPGLLCFSPPLLDSLSIAGPICKCFFLGSMIVPSSDAV